MKQASQNLTAQESLDIITGMIRQAKGNARRNGFHFLLWGWVVVVANLGMYALTLLNYPYPYVVWAITIPAWIISFIKGYRDKKADRVYTHLDRISLWLWIMFGLAIVVFVVMGQKINYQINPVILTTATIPTFVSGALLRFKPLMFGGASFWAFGLITFMLPYEVQPLMSAVAIICGFLLPGYLLKRRAD